MKQLYNKLFSPRLEGGKWYDVIRWWERRRGAFNVILLCSGHISCVMFFIIIMLKSISTDDVAFNFGMTLFGMTLFFFAPALVLALAFVFGFIANLFYTSGWALELILRLFRKVDTNKIAVYLFKIMLILTVTAIFIPSIGLGVFVIVKGERLLLPSSYFAKDKPDFQELIGTYYLDPDHSDFLSDDDKSLKGYITLNSDSTFITKNFPVFNDDNSNEYDICNGTGKWKTKEYHLFYNNSWAVLISYHSLTISKTNQPRQVVNKSLFVYNKKPPYKLYDAASDLRDGKGEIHIKK